MEVIRLNPGMQVVCDGCNKDYSDSVESGGILFVSLAICPKCEPAWRRNAAKFGETNLIVDACPPGKSFAEWVRGLRQ